MPLVVRPVPAGAAVRRGAARPLPSRLAAVLVAFAVALGVVVSTGEAASAVAANPSSTAVRYGLAQLGKPYLYGGKGPSSFDCSGLTMQAYASAGVAIPRVSRDQYRRLPKVARASARPGDLVFWGSNAADPASVYHVGIYLGSNTVLDAPKTGSVVSVRTMWTSGLMPYAARPAAAAGTSLLPVEVGSTGDDVRAVQMRLRANGYAVVVDGAYGPATRAAVTALQSKVGLTGSGLVGPSTWNWLVTHGVTNRVS